MNTNRLLISSAMLTALCDQKGLDNLSLLEPFVRISLVRSTEVNTQIDKKSVVSHLQDDFAFSDVPIAVLDKVLLRMARRKDKLVDLTSPKDNQFVLLHDLSSERRSFDMFEAQAQSELDCVIAALLKWFQSVAPQLKATHDRVVSWLGDFFESRGVDVLFEVDELRTSTVANTDAINYQIGRFIIDSKEHNTPLFDKIVHITQGMMLVSAIYIDTRPASKFKGQQGLADTAVFLDTTLLLYAMGYKTSAQETAATTLLKLLTDSGAHLFVFPGHFQEIIDILCAFKFRDGYSKTPYQTLERLEENSWTTTEIDSEIRFLENRLKDKLNVLVYRDNTYVDENGNLREDKRSYIDICGLSSHIKARIRQYEKNPDMLKNDVDAIGSIIAQRNGMKFETLENCPAILVSTNYSLIRESNYFLKYLTHKQLLAPTISDTDLTTILWLKYGFLDQSIPRLLLVQHASAAIEPTDAVLEKFFQVTKNLEERGTLTPDEAAFMRYDIYARGEITALCGGESTAIDDTSVLAVRDRMKSHYYKESTQEALDLKKELHTEKAKSAQIQQKADNAVHIANKEKELAQQATMDAKRALLDDVTERSQKKASRRTTGIINLTRIFLIVITVIFMSLSFRTGFSSQTGVIAIALAIIAACSTLTLFLPMFKILNSLKSYIYRKTFDNIYAKEYSKIESQIKILNSGIPKSEIPEKASMQKG